MPMFTLSIHLSTDFFVVFTVNTSYSVVGTHNLKNERSNWLCMSCYGSYSWHW